MNARLTSHWVFPVRVTRRRPGTVLTLWRSVACDRHWTNEPHAASLKGPCYKRRSFLFYVYLHG